MPKIMHTCFSQVFHRRKAFLHGRRNGSHRHHIAQHQVPNHRSPNQSPSLVQSLDVGCDEDGRRIREGYRLELKMPTGDDLLHVETENERQRNDADVTVSVLGKRLETSSTLEKISNYRMLRIITKL